MPKSKQNAAKGVESAENNDPRFSSFTTDPRFRLPSKRHTRTTIDKRFSRMLNDEDFSNTAKVDRYGRKLSSNGKKKALERLYVPDTEDVEVEDDEVVERELSKAGAVDTGYEEDLSTSEEDDDDEDGQEGGVDIADEEAFPDMKAEQAAVEMGEVTSRFAAVNLDWDNIRSVDLMAVFSSFTNGGRIRKVSIYQSEYGKERMEREELEGPPREIFTRKQDNDDISDTDSSTDGDDEVDEEQIKKDLQKADEGNEFNGAALRQYQLERLRYFYAVVICSDAQTAQTIYEATDGTEYLSSANFFDLRFIPDDTEFDDKPRDECDSVPSDYRPTEFVTDALQHSKVKLTWDMNPEETSRKDAIKRAFGGSRADIGENDLKAYLGSDSEEESEEELVEEANVEGGDTLEVPQMSKKEIARQKMRAALGLADEPIKSSKKTAGPVGDLEITFTAGLSSAPKGGVFENEPVIQETTAEKYIRLEKERKARRKERSKAKREGRDPDTINDKDRAGSEGSGDDEEAAPQSDLGFDDPFFAVDSAEKEKAAKSVKKEERRKKRDARQAEVTASAAEKAQLELLMQDNSNEAAPHLDHFDINEIARIEKKRGKRGKKSKAHGDKDTELKDSKRGGLQETFEMDVQDPRFGKLYESHEFAIDPSNPRFKATEGMKKLLEEGRRKRDVHQEAQPEERKRKPDRLQTEGGLSELVESVKKKSKR